MIYLKLLKNNRNKIDIENIKSVIKFRKELKIINKKSIKSNLLKFELHNK